MAIPRWARLPRVTGLRIDTKTFESLRLVYDQAISNCCGASAWAVDFAAIPTLVVVPMMAR